MCRRYVVRRAKKSLFVDCYVVFYKKKTAYEMRISDWSSDVCASDLIDRERISAALGIGAGDFADQPAKRNDAARHRSGHPAGGFLALCRAKIGRASCRESVCQYV